ncbi:MAG: hypothetical protein QOG15_358 [Solirubrobacteraceae bacterium]|nr:hypothetical protein [Solirubrobacteraceae bacterium]
MPVPSVCRRLAVTILVLALVAAAGAGCGGDGAKKDATTSKSERLLLAKIAATERAVKAKPNDPQALVDLTERYAQYAYQVGNPTGASLGPQGLAQLRKAAATWERYLALKPEHPDVQLATVMTRAYGQAGLNDPRKAIRAMEVAAANRKPPSGPIYAQLALLYYQQHDYREGDLAADRAVQLTDPAGRRVLRRQLRQLRSQAKKLG